jgi:hypothetical protein
MAEREEDRVDGRDLKPLKEPGSDALLSKDVLARLARIIAPEPPPEPRDSRA